MACACTIYRNLANVFFLFGFLPQTKEKTAAKSYHISSFFCSWAFGSISKHCGFFWKVFESCLKYCFEDWWFLERKINNCNVLAWYVTKNSKENLTVQSMECQSKKASDSRMSVYKMVEKVAFTAALMMAKTMEAAKKARGKRKRRFSPDFQTLIMIKRTANVLPKQS